AAAAVTPAATAATVATPAATAAAATTAVAPGASQSILQNSQQNIQQTNIAVNGTNNQVVTKFAKSSGQVSKGAVIDQQVPTTSPLYRMGLRSGDIITKVDGNPVSQLVDIRRIKENSTIEYVRGNQIKVAGKPILQSATSDVAKFYTGAPAVEFDTKGIVEVQQTEMTLYEYYDNMAKAEANAASSDMPAQEYGADEY
ncbi:MAG: PDZ domain-containing protein, partial [Planctomycetia bacterium]|nr:PDZ domain-containing protein [Planctomycetia bacterium]